MTTGYGGSSGIAKMSTNGGSTFTVIGGVRVSNLTLNDAPVDITNVSSAGWRELLPGVGVKSVDVSLDGVICSDTALKALQAMAASQTSSYFQIPWGAAGKAQGLFVVDTFAMTMDNTKEQTFTCQLRSTGAVTITADT